MPSERTVTVTDDIYTDCERIVEETTFDSVNEYVQFVLRQVVTADDASNDDRQSTVDEEHLESLGYL